MDCAKACYFSLDLAYRARNVCFCRVGERRIDSFQKTSSSDTGWKNQWRRSWW